VESDDCARLWDEELEQGAELAGADSFRLASEPGAVCGCAATSLSDSRLLLGGGGLAPLGLATRLLRKSAR
jgi:hypothetical protein